MSSSRAFDAAPSPVPPPPPSPGLLSPWLPSSDVAAETQPSVHEARKLAARDCAQSWGGEARGPAAPRAGRGRDPEQRPSCARTSDRPEGGRELEPRALQPRPHRPALGTAGHMEPQELQGLWESPDESPGSEQATPAPGP